MQHFLTSGLLFLAVAVTTAAADDSPLFKITTKDGYIEMQLPKAFFEGNPKSITVNWIDFYRG